MSKDNCVLIDRDIMNWEYADDNTIFAFFIKLIIIVNCRNKKWKGINVKRGSIIGSTESLCNALRMKRDSFLRCRKILSESGSIEVKVKENQYQVIAVKNYNNYQNKNNFEALFANQVIGNTDNKTDKRTDKKAHTTNSISLKGYRGTKKKTRQPAALGGRQSAAQRIELSYADIIHYAREVKIGSPEDASAFRQIFNDTNTCFPPNWQEVFVWFAKASDTKVYEFIEKMKAGEYRDKWGAARE